MFEIEANHRAPKARGGHSLTVPLACQRSRTAAAAVPFGTLFLVSSPLRKGKRHGSGNTTLYKQINRLGLAEIKPLKAIRLKIKQKFNEN